MHRGRLKTLADNRRQLPGAEARCQTLQRVPRGDLRLPAFVLVATDASAGCLPHFHTFGFEPIEADVIDGLEGQAVLKSSF